MTTPAPACWLPTCPAPIAVQWQRRHTAEELAAIQRLHAELADEIAALADPALPSPILPPEPTGQDCVCAVYACTTHAIHLDGATLIHQATCAPNPATLPACGCTPEPLPPDPDAPGSATVTLPTGWTVTDPAA